MKHLLYIFLAVLICVACNNNTRYIKAMTEAEAIINEFPDGAAHIIYTAMSDAGELPDSVKAMFALTIGQAHKNAGNAMADDSLLLFALDYYKNAGCKDSELLRAYVLSADHLRWRNKLEESMQVANEGLALAKSVGNMEYSMSLLVSLLLADKEVNGYKYSRQILELREGEPNNYRMYNEMANLYSFAGKFDSATYFYEKGIELALAAEDEFTAYFTKHNYADMLGITGNPAKALRLQKEAIDYFGEKKPEKKYDYYMQVSWYFLNLNQIDSARHYLELFQTNRIPRNNNLFLDNSYIMLNEVIRYMESGVFNLNNLIIHLRHITQELDKKEKQRLEQLENKNRAELHNMQLTIDKQRNRFVLIAFFFAAILATLLILYYIRKRKHEMIEKEEELEALKHLLAEVEKNKTPTVKDDNFFKQILLQQLGLIRLVAATPTTQNQELLKQMGRITNKDVEVDSLLIWDDLYPVIDSIYNNFYSNMMERYGDSLSEKEVQLCCLLKANFSTKEISVIAQQSTQTIYQRKTTIRQKLKMDEKEDIAEFLSK